MPTPDTTIEVKLTNIEKNQQDMILKLDTIQTILNTLVNIRINPFQSSPNISMQTTPISGNKKINSHIKKN